MKRQTETPRDAERQKETDRDMRRQQESERDTKRKQETHRDNKRQRKTARDSAYSCSGPSYKKRQGPNDGPHVGAVRTPCFEQRIHPSIKGDRQERQRCSGRRWKGPVQQGSTRHARRDSKG